jgi:hypothetical protein
MRRVGLLLVVCVLTASTVAQASKTASWSGRWQRAAGQYGAGSGLFTLSQKGTHVTGTYHWKAAPRSSAAVWPGS